MGLVGGMERLENLAPRGAAGRPDVFGGRVGTGARPIWMWNWIVRCEIARVLVSAEGDVGRLGLPRSVPLDGYGYALIELSLI